MEIGKKLLLRVCILTMLVTEAAPLLVALTITTCMSSPPAACPVLAPLAQFAIVVVLVLNAVTFLLGLLGTGQAGRLGWFAGILLGTPLLVLGEVLWWVRALPQLSGWLLVLCLVVGVILPQMPPLLASVYGLRASS
jgi:hypothetical protein